MDHGPTYEILSQLVDIYRRLTPIQHKSVIMIRNTVVNTINFFYPLGNTPPVSLTQDVPFGQNADILLLGCGDARNILFTCFVDPGRKLDITCCDIEPAIIARNILLYTLILDDTKEDNWKRIWNIYYHWKLDATSLKRLEDQTEKLLSISSHISQWCDSAYGHMIQFRNIKTLAQVRKSWQGYSSRGLSPKQQVERQTDLQKKIKKAKEMRKEMLGDHESISCMRSAAPTGIQAVQDIQLATKRWWTEGTMEPRCELSLRADLYNPAFLWSDNQSLVLHYGTDPLSGFPLSTTYVPLLSDNCLYVGADFASSTDRLTACAQQHFRQWTGSFREAGLTGTTIRFCVADALAFAMTLQNATTAGGGNSLTANLFSTPWTCEPLIIDEVELRSDERAAPRRFDIIDTSNLVDHLGPLNLLPICAKLLNNTRVSTIYTECLVQSSSDEQERIAKLLGGNTQTIALLLNLSPCEIWTNATNSPEDESMLNVVDKIIGTKTTVAGASQVRSRLRWKQAYVLSLGESRPVVKIGASRLARLMHKLYNHMFDHENLSSMLTDANLEALTNKANPYYNRASFAVLVEYVRQVITTNWAQCLQELRSLIVATFSQAPLGANFYQELLLYLDMLGTCTNVLPTVGLDDSRDAEVLSLFKVWSDIPIQVCITVRVPRRRLHVFTSKALGGIGTPSLRCTIEGGGIISRPWSNIFAAVQVAFGQARPPAGRMSALQIVQDDSTWWGSSDMFVSFFVPTWTILQSDKTIPWVRCGLLPTPQYCFIFLGDLGLTLDIHSVEITSECITISRYMPAMAEAPRLVSKPPSLLTKMHPVVDTTLASEDDSIMTLTHRITCATEAEKKKLSSRGSSVLVVFKDWERATVQIGGDLVYHIIFPVPVDYLRHKVRIARKSSFVEVEAAPWDPLKETTTCLLFPITLPEQSSHRDLSPIPWTATQLRLDILPIVDSSKKDKLQWLVTHASTMFSTRERQIRENGLVSRRSFNMKLNMRAEMKDSLFSMLMSYTGLQGQNCRAFGLTKPVSGINVLFLPSALRLDLINRTVVLDAAAVPLTKSMSADKKVKGFYQSLTALGVMQIKVLDEELRCWKSILPALSERCRMWMHTLTCEYVKEAAVPIAQGLDDGYSSLCSCGVGKFPAGYLEDFKLDGLQYVLKRYATRVAISPLFAIPYVEECFTMPLSRRQNTSAASAGAPVPNANMGCGNCGQYSKKDSYPETTGNSISSQALPVCARCKKMRYCSPECQRTDWKRHKAVCSS